MATFALNPLGRQKAKTSCNSLARSQHLCQCKPQLPSAPCDCQHVDVKRSAHSADFSDVSINAKTNVDTVSAIAKSGTSSAHGPLPHLVQIQRAFGPVHDLSGVNAHTGVAATRAAIALGAMAYTTGEQIVFRNPPSLRLAAHEATHVIQQRAGLTLPGGMGQTGDPYEQQADKVADRIARGKTASDLLPKVASTPSCPVSQAAIQRFAEISGEPYDRLADDGKLAVKDHTRNAWAQTSNIDKSNKVLGEINSVAEIEEISGANVTVTPPATGKGSVTLKKFKMVDRVSGTEAELPNDCGEACQEMLGANAAGYESFVARNMRGTTEEFTGPSPYIADDNAAGGIVSTTEKLSGDIYIRIMKREFNKDLNRVDAVTEWDGSSDADKDRLSKKYGINKYAAPSVGQGITIGSERDMPGGELPGKAGGRNFNFHFALNLMSSGHDYITLEDYASSGVKYYFDMYGPASKGQSFAEAKSNVEALGAKTTTMVVQHPESLSGIVNKNNVFFEDDPGKPKYNTTLARDTEVQILRRGHSWMKVKVITGPKAGESGWIMNQFFTDN